jgi:hypothetical protein
MALVDGCVSISWIPGATHRMLNWIRKYQQVLFLLDVLGAGGRNIDTRYTWSHTTGERRSTLKFSHEATNRQILGCGKRCWGRW